MQTILATRHDQRPATSDQRRPAAVLAGNLAPIIPTPCALHPAAEKFPRRMRAAAAGFTLIEMLVTMGIAGVLSSVAYPSFMGQVQKARRADVLVAMLNVQMAQERWRSNNRSYGSLSDIAVPSVSGARHYTLQISAATESGYDVMATATGVQSRDSACRYMKLSVASAELVYASGADATTANPAAANRLCWNL
jgi:type IV pilus assembly protein PilE